MSVSLARFYPLENIPDIIVIKGKYLNYYIVHAGMVAEAFELISRDVDGKPEGYIQAYRFDESVAGYDAPLRQVTWSRKGLYSQRSHWHVWPSEENLHEKRTCIIHGHTPFCMLKKGDYFRYGDKNLFWVNQKIWFSEDFQSFDIDSNIKGRYNPEDSYRGLSCICLESVEKIASLNGNRLTAEAVRESQNFVFGMGLVYGYSFFENADIDRILTAQPAMKNIYADSNRRIWLE